MSSSQTHEASAEVAHGIAPKARLRAAEALKRLPWLTEAQAVLGWGIILLLIALLGAVYLSQVSRIAITGRTVQHLQNDLDVLKRENATLEKDIAAAQSLERLSSLAIQLGFVRSQQDDIEYLVVPGYPTTPEALSLSEPGIEPNVDGESAPPETMRQAAWLLLKARLGGTVRGEAGDQ